VHRVRAFAGEGLPDRGENRRAAGHATRESVCALGVSALPARSTFPPAAAPRSSRPGRLLFCGAPCASIQSRSVHLGFTLLRKFQRWNCQRARLPTESRCSRSRHFRKTNPNWCASCAHACAFVHSHAQGGGAALIQFESIHSRGVGKSPAPDYPASKVCPLPICLE
jgi:hypothetical protein